MNPEVLVTGTHSYYTPGENWGLALLASHLPATFSEEEIVWSRPRSNCRPGTG
jgi:hypothetical protein